VGQGQISHRMWRTRPATVNMLKLLYKDVLRARSASVLTHLSWVRDISRSEGAFGLLVFSLVGVLLSVCLHKCITNDGRFLAAIYKTVKQYEFPWLYERPRLYLSPYRNNTQATKLTEKDA